MPTTLLVKSPSPGLSLVNDKARIGCPHRAIFHSESRASLDLVYGDSGRTGLGQYHHTIAHRTLEGSHLSAVYQFMGTEVPLPAAHLTLMP